MNYNYLIYDNGTHLVFKFGDGFQVLDYVFEEMSDSGRPFFKKYIERVLFGESDFEEIDKNMCGMEIKKDYTLIYPTHDLDDSDEITIETKYLLELINIWVEENKL